MDLHTHLNGTTFDEQPMQDYQSRYYGLRNTENAKNALIEDLLNTVKMLSKDNKQLQLDLERATDFNREYQERKKALEMETRQLRGFMARNPFVLILLDGDGMIFQDYLLQKGEQGGKEAAGQLWKAIRDHLEQAFTTLPAEVKVVCRVYGNVKGLAETCYRAGIVDKASKVEEFARGFTRSKHLFDFIDVGSGKDRADEKLSEIFKLHLYDCHCQQIFFGGSHDNGYARLLEDCCTSDVAYTQRITLIEGIPFEREIRALQGHFRTTKFEELFRSSKIVLNQHTQQQHHSFSNKTGGVSSSSNNATSNSPPVQRSVSVSMSRTTTDSSNHNDGVTNGLLPTSFSANPTPQTWATAATTMTLASGLILASPPSTPQPTSSTTTTTILRNRKGQRLDPEIKVDKAEVKRVKALKMCNVHFLRGNCQHGSECSHDHEYKPTAKELITVRYIARLAPCKYGTECTDERCIYGHRCPGGSITPASGGCAFWGDRCRFPDEMHFGDTTAVKGIKI